MAYRRRGLPIRAGAIALRLPPIPPSELNDEQRDLYDTLRAGIAKQFQGFQTARADGALLGAFNPWLHEPGSAERFGN